MFFKEKIILLIIKCTFLFLNEKIAISLYSSYKRNDKLKLICTH